jgi:hypothetical protein
MSSRKFTCSARYPLWFAPSWPRGCVLPDLLLSAILPAKWGKPGWTEPIGPLLGPPQRGIHNIQGRAPERVPKKRSEIVNRI